MHEALGSIPSTSLTPSEQGKNLPHFMRTSYDANQAIQEHLRDTLTVWMSVTRYDMVLHIWIREKPGLCSTLREALIWSKPVLISSHLTSSSEEPLGAPLTVSPLPNKGTSSQERLVQTPKLDTCKVNA